VGPSPWMTQRFFLRFFFFSVCMTGRYFLLFVISSMSSLTLPLVARFFEFNFLGGILLSLNS